MTKKGQAAMEFLMTYGWAILVVLIAIGALAYFGVLSPSRFLPDSCTIAPGLACGEFKASAADTSNVVIYLQNGMGSSLTVSALTLTPVDATSCAIVGTIPASIADGGSELTTWTCAGITAASEGDKFKADIGMEYTKSGETLTHTVTGTIVTKVEA